MSGELGGGIRRTVMPPETGVEKFGRDLSLSSGRAQLGEALKRKQKKRTGREGMVSRVVRPGSVC